MKIKNYNLKVHQPKEIEDLKELRDSVNNGLDGVERKLVKFVKNIQAIEETLRLIVEMASKAIEEAENYKKRVPESYKEYLYYMLHGASMELQKMKIPFKFPRLESEILKDLIDENELLANLIYEKGGVKGIRNFANIEETKEEVQNNGKNK